MKFVIFTVFCTFQILITSAQRNITEISLTGKETYNITFEFSDDTNPTVDLLWWTRQDIELNVLSLEIDTKSGDFILISKYKIDWDPANSATPTPNLRTTTQYILLDESQGFPSTTQLVNLNTDENVKGISVYFHGEPKYDRRQFQKGFTIEVSLIDQTEPIGPTTPEPIITTPDPSTDIYVTKFVTGKTPAEFVKDIRLFRQLLAEMTNTFCVETRIVLQRNATESDVSVPLSFLRFCDRSWLPYETCVEAKFAIAVYESPSNEYVMHSNRIQIMWASYKDRFGLTDFEPPSQLVLDAPNIWVGVFLGVILFLLPILCIVWLKKWSNDKAKSLDVLNILSSEPNDTRIKWDDSHNPVYKATLQEDRFVYDNPTLVNDEEPIRRENSAYNSEEEDVGEEDIHYDYQRTQKSHHEEKSTNAYQHVLTDLESKSDYSFASY